MSSVPPWVLAYRPWHPGANLNLERQYYTGGIGNGNACEVWSTNFYPGGSGYTATISNASPYPWAGVAAYRVAQAFTALNSQWIVSYQASAGHLPELFTEADHTLRVSLRVVPHLGTCSGCTVIVWCGSDPAAIGVSSSILPATNLFGFGNRWANSWQNLRTGAISYTGSAKIFAQLVRGSTAATVDISMNDLRFYLDELEINQHADQEFGFTVEESALVTQAGYRYRTALTPRRRWTLPVEYLVESQWTRLESWYLSGAKLWLGAPSLEAWYPVVMTGQRLPTGKLHPGSLVLRGGEIELEGDYTEPLNGPWHGEPLP